METKPPTACPVSNCSVKFTGEHDRESFMYVSCGHCVCEACHEATTCLADPVEAAKCFVCKTHSEKGVVAGDIGTVAASLDKLKTGSFRRARKSPLLLAEQKRLEGIVRCSKEATRVLLAVQSRLVEDAIAVHDVLKVVVANVPEMKQLLTTFSTVVEHAMKWIEATLDGLAVNIGQFYAVALACLTLPGSVALKACQARGNNSYCVPWMLGDHLFYALEIVDGDGDGGAMVRIVTGSHKTILVGKPVSFDDRVKLQGLEGVHATESDRRSKFLIGCNAQLAAIARSLPTHRPCSVEFGILSLRLGLFKDIVFSVWKRVLEDKILTLEMLRAIVVYSCTNALDDDDVARTLVTFAISARNGMGLGCDDIELACITCLWTIMQRWKHCTGEECLDIWNIVTGRISATLLGADVPGQGDVFNECFALLVLVMDQITPVVITTYSLLDYLVVWCLVRMPTLFPERSDIHASGLILLNTMRKKLGGHALRTDFDKDTPLKRDWSSSASYVKACTTMTRVYHVMALALTSVHAQLAGLQMMTAEAEAPRVGVELYEESEVACIFTTVVASMRAHQTVAEIQIAAIRVLDGMLASHLMATNKLWLEHTCSPVARHIFQARGVDAIVTALETYSRDIEIVSACWTVLGNMGMSELRLPRYRCVSSRSVFLLAAEGVRNPELAMCHVDIIRVIMTMYQSKRCLKDANTDEWQECISAVWDCVCNGLCTLKKTLAGIDLLKVMLTAGVQPRVPVPRRIVDSLADKLQAFETCTAFTFVRAFQRVVQSNPCVITTDDNLVTTEVIWGMVRDVEFVNAIYDENRSGTMFLFSLVQADWKSVILAFGGPSKDSFTMLVCCLARVSEQYCFGTRKEPTVSCKIVSDIVREFPGFSGVLVHDAHCFTRLLMNKDIVEKIGKRADYHAARFRALADLQAAIAEDTFQISWGYVLNTSAFKWGIFPFVSDCPGNVDVQREAWRLIKYMCRCESRLIGTWYRSNFMEHLGMFLSPLTISMSTGTTDPATLVHMAECHAFFCM